MCVLLLILLVQGSFLDSERVHELHLTKSPFNQAQRYMTKISDLWEAQEEDYKFWPNLDSYLQAKNINGLQILLSTKAFDSSLSTTKIPSIKHLFVKNFVRWKVRVGLSSREEWPQLTRQEPAHALSAPCTGQEQLLSCESGETSRSWVPWGLPGEAEMSMDRTQISWEVGFF